MGTNSSFERAEERAQSAVGVTGDGWSIGALEDGCDGCGLLPGRTANSGASVHARGIAVTGIVSSSVPTPMEGPTSAT